MHLSRPLGLLAALTLTAGVAACGGTDAGSNTAAAPSNHVKAGDRTCDLAKTTLAAGRHTFTVENVGSDATEVYVYGRSGQQFSRIMAEKENIGPGTSQRLELELAAGDYQVACKPGMTGSGIRTNLTVTSGAASTAPQ